MDADTLIRNTTIITMDAERRIVTDGAIAWSGDRIVALGKSADVDVTAKTTIDGRRFLVTPGFVNGHVHLTEALLKGFMPEALPFDESLFTWVMPLYEAHTPAEQQAAARLAALSMMRTGTTTFLDASTTVALDEVFEAVEPTGLRGRFGRWQQDRAFGPDGQLEATDAALRA